MDGEPWVQKASTVDILYHGQVPMLTHPVTKLQEAIGVMADSLEWAKVNQVINEEQYQAILNQYQTRMRQSISPIYEYSVFKQTHYPHNCFIYSLIKWLWIHSLIESATMRFCRLFTRKVYSRVSNNNIH